MLISDAKLPKHKPEPSRLITISIWDANGKYNRKWDSRNRMQFLKLTVLHFAMWVPASLARYLHLLEQCLHLSILQWCPKWVFNKLCLLITQKWQRHHQGNMCFELLFQEWKWIFFDPFMWPEAYFVRVRNVIHDHWIFQEGTRGLVLGQPQTYQPN